MKELAEKYNVPIEKIEEVENAMWHWVKTEMIRGTKNEEDTFENIYLRYLGTFHVQKGMIKHMKKHDK